MDDLFRALWMIYFKPYRSFISSSRNDLFQDLWMIYFKLYGWFISTHIEIEVTTFGHMGT